MYNRIPVFYYHSIAPVKDVRWGKSFLTLELVYFEDFLKYLKSVGYQCLFLKEYFEIRKDPAAQKKKLICLTFDDGYLDNYVYVYPLLQKYGAKGTIFVSPEYVQENEEPRLTIEDLWEGKCNIFQLDSLGFLSWKEMVLMEESGVIDIQSHTLTHTKYFINDKIREFHHPHSDFYYPIGNLFPERKPYHLTDQEFINLIPFGTPFFKEQSALIAKKVTMNKDFQEECVTQLNGNNWDKYQFDECYENIEKLYKSYQGSGNMIINIETQSDYEKRIREEIILSKKIIEDNLQKVVEHICWPHGDYNDFCHQIAMEAGYLSSHIVLKMGERNIFNNRFDRTGSGVVKNNRFLTLLKAKYKLNSYRGSAPYSWILGVYNKIKYGV